MLVSVTMEHNEDIKTYQMPNVSQLKCLNDVTSTITAQGQECVYTHKDTHRDGDSFYFYFWCLPTELKQEVGFTKEVRFLFFFSFFFKKLPSGLKSCSQSSLMSFSFCLSIRPFLGCKSSSLCIIPTFLPLTELDLASPGWGCR